MIRVGVVGAGLIGTRRAISAHAHPRTRLVAVCDSQAAVAEALAGRLGAQPLADWRDLIVADVDAVVVATPNHLLGPIGEAALEAGKHVLCEKPMGRNLSEAQSLAGAASRSGRVVKIGFNLRFHPGLRRAHDEVVRMGIGEPIFARAVYGHGGRPDYATEWRGDPERAGGGELLDQGVHLLDLVRWFLGEVEVVAAATNRGFWDLPGGMEDNAFVMLRSRAGAVAQLHTSWTQWRNRFAFEVYGRQGAVAVNGLGGSYGTETLTLTRRRPEAGPPDEEELAFTGVDPSWDLDWADFASAIEGAAAPAVDAADGLEVMRLVDQAYRLARAQATVLS